MAHLGPTGPRWAHVGPMNFAIWDGINLYHTYHLVTDTTNGIKTCYSSSWHYQYVVYYVWFLWIPFCEHIGFKSFEMFHQLCPTQLIARINFAFLGCINNAYCPWPAEYRRTAISVALTCRLVLCLWDDAMQHNNYTIDVINSGNWRTQMISYSLANI